MNTENLLLTPTIHDVALMLDRESVGLVASPRGGVLDSQSAKASRDPDQLRRLLSLAEIYDGGSRGNAAQISGVDQPKPPGKAHKFNSSNRF